MFAEDDNLPRSLFFREGSVGDFERAVFGTIVDDNYAQVGIVGIQRRTHRALNYFLFVVCGDQYCDFGLVGRNLGGPAENFLAHTVVHSSGPNEDQPSGHEDIAEEEDPGDAAPACVEDPESQAIESSEPEVTGWKRRHHIAAGLVEQLVDGGNLVSASADSLDDHRQGAHGLGAIASAIVHQNNVAAVQIIGAARRQMLQHIGGNLFCRLATRDIGPIVGVDAIADRDVAFFLREFERAYLIGGVRFLVDGVRRAKQCGANSHQAGEKALGEIELQPHVSGRNIAHVGMRERVIPDGVAFFINALDQTRKLIGLNANQKKRSRRVLTFQDVQNLRGPIWIGTVVEGQDDFIGAVAVAGDSIRLRRVLEILVGNLFAVGIDREIARAVGRLLFNAENFALALHVYILPRRYIFEFVGCASVSWDVPYLPQGAVFAAEAPQSEGLNTQSLGGAHVVERGDSVEEPDIVTDAALIQVAEVRIHRVIIEDNVFIGVARREPSFLNADGRGFFFAFGQLSVFRFARPVVTVVGDSADDLVFGDDGFSEGQVFYEPILRSHRAGVGPGIVLVVIHEHNAVGCGGDGRVVVFVALRRNGDVELHAAAVQIG